VLLAIGLVLVGCSANPASSETANGQDDDEPDNPTNHMPVIEGLIIDGRYFSGYVGYKYVYMTDNPEDEAWVHISCLASDPDGDALDFKFIISRNGYDDPVGRFFSGVLNTDWTNEYRKVYDTGDLHENTYISAPFGQVGDTKDIIIQIHVCDTHGAFWNAQITVYLRSR